MSLLQSIAACPNGHVQQAYYTTSLMELGNQLISQSRFQEAQQMYDMAHVVLRQPLSTTSEAVSAQIQWGYKCLLSTGDESSSSSQDAPDLYLDDECDVGPRAFTTAAQVPPIGIHGLVCDSDVALMEATLCYNKGVALQASHQTAQAKQLFELALQLLAIVTSVATPQAAVAELAMRLQNNLGVLEYQVAALDSHSRFEAAMAYAKNFSDSSSLEYATIVSNWCRVQWLSGHIVGPAVYDALKDVLRIRTAILGWNHVDTAAAHYNMGVACYSEDDSLQAMTHLMRYLQVAAAQQHGTLDVVPALIYILLIKNEDSKTGVAHELVRGLRSLQEKRSEIGTGTSDPEMASALNYIGTLLFHQQDYDHALLFFQEELRIEENLVGLVSSSPKDRDDASVSVSVTCNNLGRILQELKRFDEAALYYHRALQVDYEEIVDTTVAKEGKDAGKKSITLRTKKPASELPASQVNLYSTVWYNLGLIHDKLGEYYDAIHAFQTSLSLRKIMLGNDHPDISCLLYNIGVLQMEQQMLKDATTSFREALRIRRLSEQQSGRLNDCHIVKTLQKLATLQKDKGDVESALDSYREVLAIQRASQDYDQESHQRQRDMGTSMKEIAELLLSRGQLTPAMDMAQSGVTMLQKVATALSPSNNNDDDALFDYMGCVEELISLLMLLGSVYHECCEPLRAGALYKEASRILQQASKHFSNTTSELDALYELTELLASCHCAPEA